MFGRRKKAQRRAKRIRPTDSTPVPTESDAEVDEPTIDSSTVPMDHPGVDESAEPPEVHVMEFKDMEDAEEAAGAPRELSPDSASETADWADDAAVVEDEDSQSEHHGSDGPIEQGNGAASHDLDPNAVNEKVRKLVENVQGLDHLSELVSLPYNPFLEMDEDDVFDGKAPRALDAEVSGAPSHGSLGFDAAMDAGLTADPDEGALENPSIDPPFSLANDHFPSFMEVAHVPRRGSDEDLDESIDLTDLPIDDIHTAIGHPPMDPMPPNGGGGAKPIRNGAPLSDRDRARRTLLALNWMRRLQAHGPPSCMFLFIDHCRRMNWLDESTYIWLTALAEGVAKPDPDLTWEDLELDPLELTGIHEANLLFLDDLFTDRLRLGERGFLTTNVTEYFEVN